MDVPRIQRDPVIGVVYVAQRGEIVGIAADRKRRHARGVEPGMAHQHVGILIFRDRRHEIRRAQRARFQQRR